MKLERIKVLIVDDHAIVREGLKAVLQIDPTLHVVGEAANGKQALQMVRSLSPDVVLMDLVMPVMDGIEAARKIRSRESSILNPQIPIIALTAHALREDQQRCLGDDDR